MLDLNDNPEEKLASAIMLSYDKVNSRVSVTCLFPEPICLKASISYDGEKLPNGDFDIIVLSSMFSADCRFFLRIHSRFSHLAGSDTTLVHKNIASCKHNISYEAKLMSIHGQPKSKPRKILCYIGPKQVSGFCHPRGDWSLNETVFHLRSLSRR